jgi:hypothetical protein
MLCHLRRLGYVPSAWACNFLLKFVAQKSQAEMVVAVFFFFEPGSLFSSFPCTVSQKYRGWPGRAFGSLHWPPAAAATLN